MTLGAALSRLVLSEHRGKGFERGTLRDSRFSQSHASVRGGEASESSQFS